MGYLLVTFSSHVGQVTERGTVGQPVITRRPWHTSIFMGLCCGWPWGWESGALGSILASSQGLLGQGLSDPWDRVVISTALPLMALGGYGQDDL